MKKKLYEIAVLMDTKEVTVLLIKPVAILANDEDSAKMKAAVLAEKASGPDFDLDDCRILARLFQ